MKRGAWLLVHGPSPAARSAISGLIAEALADDFGERVLLIGPVAAHVARGPTLVCRQLSGARAGASQVQRVIDRLGGDEAFHRVIVDAGDGERQTALLPQCGHLVHCASDTFAALPAEVAPGCKITFVGQLPRATARYIPQLYRAGTCRASVRLGLLAGKHRRADLTAQELDFVNRLARAVSGRRVGLALGGGGAWGFAHIALIEALSAARVPIDVISGVSFGAIVGALYSSGGLAALEQLVRDRRRLASAILGSFVNGRPLERFVDQRVPQRWLERLPVPFIPIATTVETGEPEALRIGSVGRAVRASGSLPGLIGPTIITGVRYVDGGISCNVPANLLPAEGTGLALASDVMQRPPAADAPIKQRRPRLIGLRDLGHALNPIERVKDLVLSMSTLTHNGGALNAANAHVTYQAHGSTFAPWDFQKGDAIHAQALIDVQECVERMTYAWGALSRPEAGQ